MPRGIPCEFTPLEANAISAAIEYGWSERAIAAYVGKPRTNVQRFIRRLKSQPVQPENLEIVLPVNVLTPHRRCPQGHIQPGDAAYCVECDETGIEDHPRLRRDSRTDPKPDPKPDAPRPEPKTRKERRKGMGAKK